LGEKTGAGPSRVTKGPRPHFEGGIRQNLFGESREKAIQGKTISRWERGLGSTVPKETSGEVAQGSPEGEGQAWGRRTPSGKGMGPRDMGPEKKLPLRGS